MSCPSCGSATAYVGLREVKCDVQGCKNYNQVHAADVQLRQFQSQTKALPPSPGEYYVNSWDAVTNPANWPAAYRTHLDDIKKSDFARMLVEICALASYDMVNRNANSP